MPPWLHVKLFHVQFRIAAGGGFCRKRKGCTSAFWASKAMDSPTDARILTEDQFHKVVCATGTECCGSVKEARSGLASFSPDQNLASFAAQALPGLWAV